MPRTAKVTLKLFGQLGISFVDGIVQQMLSDFRCAELALLKLNRLAANHDVVHVASCRL